MVRLAVEQLLDTVEFPVGEAEGAMERLFCDPRQGLESRGRFGALGSPAAAR